MKTNKFAHMCMFVSNIANCSAMTDKTLLLQRKFIPEKEGNQKQRVLRTIANCVSALLKISTVLWDHLSTRLSQQIEVS
jgi:hypothetical protein